MKNFLVIPILFFFASNSFSQIAFEKAYFIDNTDKRIECFIRNVDGRNNPSGFEYRLDADDETKEGIIGSVKEFKIYGGNHYVRFRVKINRSSDKTNLLETDRAITFREEELYLKLLVEGSANLYSYEEGSIVRYFYSTQDKVISQLVYKRYKKENLEIGENNEFRQQLYNDLKCQDIDPDKILRLPYKLDPLVKLFNQYNLCQNPDFKLNEKDKKNTKFKLNARPGVNIAKLKVENNQSRTKNVDFEQKTSLRLGLELEAILPFNKNKWALFIEPTFQSYQDDQVTMPSNVSIPNGRTAKANYKSVEVPFGLRHYFFLTGKSKIFLNAGLLVDMPFNSKIIYTGLRDEIAEIGYNYSFTGGIGYNFNNKVSIEGRFLGNREVFNTKAYRSYFSSYSGFSIIFGYSVF